MGGLITFIKRAFIKRYKPVLAEYSFIMVTSATRPFLLPREHRLPRAVGLSLRPNKRRAPSS
jgi:hypothetical protein